MNCTLSLLCPLRIDLSIENRSLQYSNPFMYSKRFIITLFFYVCCCYPLTVESQILRFERAPLKASLQQPIINHVMQDSRGFLWISSREGIFRFDGKQAKSLYYEATCKNCLPDNDVRQIEAVKPSEFWIATAHGLSIYDVKSNYFFNYSTKNTALVSNNIQSICAISETQVWIGTELGLTLARHTTQPNIPKDSINIEFETFLSPDKNTSDTTHTIVNKIVKDEQDNLWIATKNKGLLYFDTKKRELLNTFVPTPDDLSILMLQIDNIFLDEQKQRLWVATSEGLSQLDTKTQKVVRNYSFTALPENSRFQSNIIKGLYAKGDYVWIGLLPVGLVAMDINQEQTRVFTYEKDNEKGIPGAFVNTLYQDDDGRLWIGTTSGLAKLDSANNYFDLFTLSFEGEKQVVTTMSGSQNSDEVWIGTLKGGVFRCKQQPQGKSLPIIQKQTVAGGVITLHQGKDALWIGTSEGLVQYAHENEQVTVFKHNPDDENSLSSDFIMSILEDKDQNLWVGTRDAGLNFLDLKTGNIKRYNFERRGTPDATLHQNILSIAQDKDGDIWIGTARGLSTWSKQHKFKHFVSNKRDSDTNAKPVLIDEAVYDIYADDSDNKIWFVTKYGGVHVYDKNNDSMAYYTEQNSDIISNQLLALVKDKQGDFWFFSSGNGVSKLNPQTQKIYNFTAEAGLQSNTFYGAKIDSHGSIMAYGEGGFNIFNPAKLPLLSASRGVYLKSLHILDELLLNENELAVLEKIHLRHNQNFFSIDFDLIDFSPNTKSIYAYRLKGLEDKWTYIEDIQRIHYTNVSPGNYTLEIAVGNRASEQYDLAYQIPIQIDAPFYRTWWFAIISLLTIGMLIGLGYKVRLNSIKQQNLRLETLVSERTDALEKANQVLAKQKEEILQKTKNLEIANTQTLLKSREIDAQNKNITASINYGRRIQEAMLPRLESIKSAFKDAFVFFKPRDIVSGDFYWFAHIPAEPVYEEVQNFQGIQRVFKGFSNDKYIIAAIDCTGHGVPGAFMAMLGDAYLNQIVNIQHVHEAECILEELDKSIRQTLKQEQGDNRDGMDMAICVIEPDKHSLIFAGAKNPIYYVQENNLHVIKGDPRPIGGLALHPERETKPFQSHQIKIDKPTTIYLFSDGYQDQFGGRKGRKFMRSQFRKLLLDIHKMPMNEQERILDERLLAWQGEEAQVDDILVIGFKIN
ncbi:MAG: SpoIIE family protein phosphatase [Bernardetiaceae bacterium]|nr:SpoIIE family protein phosphatase [Bernardetiaceae bacterium]